MKGSKSNLKKVEILISEAGYVLRYEKGNFKPGYCILEEKKVIVVNKFYPLEAKFNSLVELLELITFDEQNLSEASQILIQKLKKREDT